MDKPHKYGSNWRTKNRRLQRRVRETWEYFPSDPEGFIAELRVKTAKYDDPEVSMETFLGSYGDRDEDKFTITGWQDATDDEIEDAERALAERNRSQNEHLARLEAQLRAAKPELFKEG